MSRNRRIDREIEIIYNTAMTYLQFRAENPHLITFVIRGLRRVLATAPSERQAINVGISVLRGDNLAEDDLRAAIDPLDRIYRRTSAVPQSNDDVYTLVAMIAINTVITGLDQSMPLLLFTRVRALCNREQHDRAQWVEVALPTAEESWSLERIDQITGSIVLGMQTQILVTWDDLAEFIRDPERISSMVGVISQGNLVMRNALRGPVQRVISSWYTGTPTPSMLVSEALSALASEYEWYEHTADVRKALALAEFLIAFFIYGGGNARGSEDAAVLRLLRAYDGSVEFERIERAAILEWRRWVNLSRSANNFEAIVNRFGRILEYSEGVLPNVYELAHGIVTLTNTERDRVTPSPATPVTPPPVNGTLTLQSGNTLIWTGASWIPGLVIPGHEEESAAEVARLNRTATSTLPNENANADIAAVDAQATATERALRADAARVGMNFGMTPAEHARFADELVRDPRRHVDVGAVVEEMFTGQTVARDRIDEAAAALRNENITFQMLPAETQERFLQELRTNNQYFQKFVSPDQTDPEIDRAVADAETGI